MNPLKLICIIICLYTFTAYGQSNQSKIIYTKIDSLKKILNQADTLRPEDMGKDGLDINSDIYNQLTKLLAIPSIVNYNLDSLLEHPFLGITHSKDKRLWIFSWYENTGGSFRSNLNLVHYRNKSNKLPLGQNFIYTSPDSDVSFCLYGAWFTKIYKLKSPGKDIYLCLGSVIGCNTCCAEVATIIELTNKGINHQYPAFADLNGHDNNKGFSSCFILDARCGDIEKFEYNPKTQTISFSYLTDDLTPIKQEENKPQKRITEQLKF